MTLTFPTLPSSELRAGVYPAVIDGPEQFDFDPLPRESNEIGNTFQRAIHTGRADLQAFVIDIFDVKNARQLTRNQFAVFDPDPLGAINRDTQQPKRRALDVNQLEVQARQRFPGQCENICHTKFIKNGLYSQPIVITPAIIAAPQTPPRP